MKENILELKDVYYEYEEGTPALKCINIKIEKGKTTAVLGSNGAGKSTLFHHFNGILKPSRGKVYFNNEEYDYSRKGLMKLRKYIGLVFQDPDSQLFSANVYQDISFGPMNLKLSEEEVAHRVQCALNSTGITDLANRPVHSLSFGQKKRVAIAGVLAMEPEVIILDEPTAGLDPMAVNELMELLRKLQNELGITVVISTHDIDIVPLYCNNVYVLHKGNVVLKGTPKEIFEQKDIIRSVNLRLPRIGHLMEVLKQKDGFIFEGIPTVISDARKAIKNYIETLLR